MSNDIVFKEPTKIYRGNYNSKFKHKLINHMKMGKSLASFAGSIGVSPTTINTWIDKHPDFKEAYEIAKSANLEVWEDIAMEQAQGHNKGNSSTLMFMMKNQHHEHYKDKQVIESEGNVVFQIDTGIPVKPKELEEKPIEADAVVIEEDEDLL